MKRISLWRKCKSEKLQRPIKYTEFKLNPLKLCAFNRIFCIPPYANRVEYRIFISRNNEIGSCTVEEIQNTVIVEETIVEFFPSFFTSADEEEIIFEKLLESFYDSRVEVDFEVTDNVTSDDTCYLSCPNMTESTPYSSSATTRSHTAFTTYSSTPKATTAYTTYSSTPKATTTYSSTSKATTTKNVLFSLLMSTIIINYGSSERFVTPLFIFWIIFY